MQNIMINQILNNTLKSSLFVLLFLALVQPFGIDRMQEGRIAFILGESLLAAVVIFLSSLAAAYIYNIRCVSEASPYTFLKITATEITLITLSLGAALLCYNGWFHEGDLFIYWHDNDGTLTLWPWLTMCLYVAIISLFVFLFHTFEYRTKKLKNELNEVRAINMLLEQRQQKLSDEENEKACDSKDEDNSQNLVTIEGQGINASLTINPANIIYVESMANYADICYIADNKTRHTTLRITLKQIRASLEDTASIVQCHRAFLVNINFVVAMSTRNQGYQLQLFGIEKQIPVSRANTETIKHNLLVDRLSS